ncbi:hypothetical protein PI125_g12141 [Phytophthora idaei]|nr:hypothetical protein PI125_g12141 [Phytophthora idaei]
MVAVQGKFVCSDNVPFGVAWEFKKQGWTRPRARDLEHKWKYIESQRRQGRGLLSQGGQIAGLRHYSFLGASAHAFYPPPMLPATVATTPAA